MRFRTLRQVVTIGCLIGASSVLSAAIFPQNKGIWPKNWPQELEPFRMRATTLGVGTGIQENIYTITFETQEEFEKIWPHILKVKTPHSELRLLNVSDKEHPTWGKFLKNSKPCVHIYAPSEGYSSKPDVDRDEFKNLDQLLKDGRAIHASAPWPDYLVREDGSLPQYVVSLTGEDGKLKWEPGEPGDEHKGFYNRARVDLELVVDGEIIDLNRIRFPENVKLIDLR
ncbi:MAG TPA: hypothetical protein VLA12_18125 [Planctomycetaceae bacterium]|nr:hypothetical protein [Planctomycetaceae bacterium]